MVCEFAWYHIDTIDQTADGVPRCRRCREELNTFEDLFGFCWRCTECGAVGGKEEEVFDPPFGEGFGNRAEYKEIEEDLWIPRCTD